MSTRTVLPLTDNVVLLATLAYWYSLSSCEEFVKRKSMWRHDAEWSDAATRVARWRHAADNNETSRNADKRNKRIMSAADHVIVRRTAEQETRFLNVLNLLSGQMILIIQNRKIESRQRLRSADNNMTRCCWAYRAWNLNNRWVRAFSFAAARAWNS